MFRKTHIHQLFFAPSPWFGALPSPSLAPVASPASNAPRARIASLAFSPPLRQIQSDQTL